MTTSPIILPTAYFPPIPYFRMLIHSREVLIEHFETYPKQTFRNRCEILSEAGRHKLVVPVTRPLGNHTLTRDVRVNYSQNWRRNHWRALMASYNSSPYFDFYREPLEEFFRLDFSSLVEMNAYALQLVCRLIGLEPAIGRTRDYLHPVSERTDLRVSFSRKKLEDLPSVKEYPQVFSHRHGFTPCLSILDLIFNTGPESKHILAGRDRIGT